MAERPFQHVQVSAGDPYAWIYSRLVYCLRGGRYRCAMLPVREEKDVRRGISFMYRWPGLWIFHPDENLEEIEILAEVDGVEVFIPPASPEKMRPLRQLGEATKALR